MRRFWDGGERWAVVQFALSGLAAMVLVVVLVLVAFNRAGREEAIASAKEVTRIGATGVIAPIVDDAVLRGDGGALAVLDRRVRASMLREPVLRITVYRPDGSVVYSSKPDNPPPDPDVRAALSEGRAFSRTSGPRDPGTDVPQDVQILDVYEPITTPAGETLIVQSCRRLASVTAAGKNLLDHFAPYVIGGVLILQLINLPLAIALVRRVRRARRHEEALLQREIVASDRERRRLATDLHNGVIQDLAGMSMALTAARHHAASSGDDAAAQRLAKLADDSRRTTRTLRQALVEIYPPNLQRAGLRSAVDDLLDGAPLHVDAALDDELDALAPDTAALVYRMVQEAVRNVVGHAEATRLDLRIERTPAGQVHLAVSDDGRGFEPRAPRNGHLGLTLIDDMVRQAGGELTVDSAPGRGTELRALVPA
jgi:two-component system, NarL family, sensor kinase